MISASSTPMETYAQMAIVVCAPFWLISEGKCWKENQRLGSLPWARAKSPLIAKPPEHVAAAGSILIIDLYNPGLVAQRKQQIAVTRRIHQSVAVGPVRQAAEMAVDVEIVKGVPRPHRIPILVEIDDAVTHDVDSAGISRKVSEGAGEAHKDQQVAISERQQFVVVRVGHEIESGVRDFLAEGRNVHFADGVAGQIYFAKDRGDRTGDHE